jgi:membrane protein YqaA with SNARE-associated domain
MAVLVTALNLAKQVTEAAAAAARPPRNPFLRAALTFGPIGIFFVSIVDSSFVPLPIPGITDIMLIIMSARHQNIPLLVVLSTAGSFLGGLFSYQVGQRGGMAFLQKHVPQRIFRRVCRWMEDHAILSVALPAILPPPMPLSPFVLAAGALQMSRKKFLTAFTASRAARHIIAAWLGMYYGRHIIRMWNSISAKYAEPIAVFIWVGIAVSCVYAFWKLYKTSRTVAHRPQPTKTTA